MATNHFPVTVADLMHQGREVLSSISDAPDQDTERLLLFALGQREPTWLYTHAFDPIPSTSLATWGELIKNRLTGTPLAYLIGEQEFYGRLFKVNENVLIPRPITEELIDASITTIKKLFAIHNHPLVIADIGTGSGCIAITLLKEIEKLENNDRLVEKIIAIDASDKALEIARENAVRYAAEKQIDFRRGNMLEPIKPNEIDLIVSNPPYVPSEEVDQAKDQPETLGLTFEPRIALDGGPDGDMFTNIIRQSDVPYVMEITGGIIESSNL